MTWGSAEGEGLLQFGGHPKAGKGTWVTVTALWWRQGHDIGVVCVCACMCLSAWSCMYTLRFMRHLLPHNRQLRSSGRRWLWCGLYWEQPGLTESGAGSSREAFVCPLEFESSRTEKLFLFFCLLWVNYFHDFILSSLLTYKLCLLMVALGFVVHIFNLP